MSEHFKDKPHWDGENDTLHRIADRCFLLERSMTIVLENTGLTDRERLFAQALANLSKEVRRLAEWRA